MSISTEIARLQQAKGDLATSIAAKGVTVPSATTLDGYAALVDQIQTGGGGLPYDARVEYIEGTGTQWIDTGIKIAGSDIVSVEMTLNVTALNSNENTVFCGAYESSGSKRLFLYIPTSGKISFAYSGTFSSTLNFSANADYVCTFAFRNGNQSVVFNAAAAGKTLSGNIPTDTSFAVFTAKSNSSPLNTPAKMKLRHFSMSKNSALLIDLVPVRVGQVGYMYDAVSGELFGNVGSGNFTLGPDIT